MSVKRALATLPLVLNSCGGSDGDSGPDYTPNEPGKGIWEGGFSAGAISVSGASGAVPQSELDNIDQAGLGLFTSSGRAFFYNQDADVLFANDDPGILQSGSTYNLVYAPDTYTAGNKSGTVTFDGNPNISTSITGQYGPAPTGYYGMNFNQEYFEAANLSQFTGVWTYTSPVGVWTLDFECVDTLCNNPGVFGITTDGSSSCTGLGGLTVIGDGSKNEYDLSIQLSGCQNSNFDGNYYGATALIDGATANNTIIMGFVKNDGNRAFFLKAVKN